MAVVNRYEIRPLDMEYANYFFISTIGNIDWFCGYWSVIAWIPVIGSRIGGIPEIIEDGKTGYIFEARNVEQLRNCIVKANNLSKEEYAQFCKNANDFALTYFNPEKYSASLVNLYKQILKKQF